MSRAPRGEAAEAERDEDEAVRGNPDLIGHEAPALALEEAARAGRLAHAWLLCGPPGVGKATLAWRFARWLLAEGARRPAAPGAPPLHLDPAHPVFRRVAANAHADLRVLRPNTGDGGVKRIIRAEDARAAIRFLALTPAEGGWRVVIVDGADAMRGEAANGLLKTLEEPPPRSVLLLTAAAPDRLLPTIRSRTRRLDLFPIEAPRMGPLLARLLPGLPAGERATLARIAGGSPGRAVQLAEGEGLAVQALVEEVLGGLARPDRRRWHAVATAVSAARDGSGFATFFILLRQAIAAAVREAARGGARPAWLGAAPLAEWGALWDRLGALAAETDTLNLDRRQAVLTGLSWLADAAGSAGA